MKKLLYGALLGIIFFEIHAATSAKNWQGHVIKNNTDVTLIVTVKHTSCEKNSSCDHHIGHVFIIPPGKSIINTEENASYPLENHGRKADCIIIEAETPTGQPTINTFRITPEARDYTISLKDNTFIVH